MAGTDTEVGKTAVAACLLQALGRRGLRAVGMKPVASGCRRTPEGLRNDDVERLVAASSVPASYAESNTYSFEPPIAPHLAAAQMGVGMEIRAVERQFEQLSARADWLVVEGAGGWYVPFNDTQTLADLASVLRLPVILVVGIRLGCINHAFLTARAVRADGLVLAGWVANQINPSFETAAQTISALGARLGAPCLARIPYGADQAWDRHGDAMTAHLLADRVV